MIKNADAPLAGVDLVYTSEDYHATAAMAQAQGRQDADALLEYAQSLSMVRAKASEYGATLIPYDDLLDTTGLRSYRLDPPKQSREGVARFFADGPSLGLEAPRLDVRRYSDMGESAIEQLGAKIDAGEPYVFAYTGRDRGLAKYLIENSDQLAKLEALRHRSLSMHFPESFEVRPFIDTPSDRYTSYRALTAASGEIIAASLIYSAHSKQENSTRRIRTDRPWDNDEVLKTFRAELEDPFSKYFLNARDVRSNVATGGKIIPLMGNTDYTPNLLERDILNAHGINPDNRSLPERIKNTSRIIGRLLGPHISLVLGFDYITSVTGAAYMLEVNTGPGEGTYQRCWDRKAKGSMAAMWMHALESVVAVQSE